MVLICIATTITMNYIEHLLVYLFVCVFFFNIFIAV